MIAQGGHSVYGASIGILMLEAQFPRIPGDMGNAQTWPFPVHYRVVRGASPDLVVRQGAPDLLDAFIDAGRELLDMGVAGITTNCGFLSLFQDPLKEALGVPVAASALMQVPFLQTLQPPGKTVGVLTISPATLTKAHLDAAGIDSTIPIGGTAPDAEFTTAILDNRREMDVARARDDMLAAARDLVARHSNISALALECTNMCPYAADIARDTGLPVYSIYDFICWFQSGLRPRQYPLP